jgi:ABC-type transporter Mla maintaining outer membrane lipid asymmetry ATPase subunit MlaF
MVDSAISSSKKNLGPSSPVEIRVEDLYKAFGDKRVLEGINLEVRRGEIYYADCSCAL